MGGGYPAQLALLILNAAAVSDEALMGALTHLEDDVESGKMTLRFVAAIVFFIGTVLRELDAAATPEERQRRIREVWAAEFGTVALEAHDMLREAARIEDEGLPDEPPWRPE